MNTDAYIKQLETAGYSWEAASIIASQDMHIGEWVEYKTLEEFARAIAPDATDAKIARAITDLDTLDNFVIQNKGAKRLSWYPCAMGILALYFN